MPHSFKYILASIIALLILFFTTEPSGLHTPLLVLPFLLLFGLSFSLVFGVLKRTRMQKRGNVRLAIVIASFPVVLLAMQSVGQLTLRDTITITLLFCIVYFYVRRTVVSIGTP